MVDSSRPPDAATVPRWTSGRESWVFRASRPEDLCGYHPHLIRSALASDEPLRYLIYSPIFDARDGPFRVGGAPASHAIALTPRRLLISRDLHLGDPASRSVRAIDLTTIGSIDVGSALAMGWMVVHHAGPTGVERLPVVFRSQGLGHFQSIVRAYGQPSREAETSATGGLVWGAASTAPPAYLTTEIEPLLAGSTPVACLRSPETWVNERRWWGTRAVCSSAWGLLVATPWGLLWAASMAPSEPGGVRFGVNVTAVRADRVVHAAIATRDTPPAAVGLLRVHAGTGRCPITIEIPFDPDDVAQAEEIVRLAKAWRDGA